MKFALTLTLITLLASGCVIRRTSSANADVMDVGNQTADAAHDTPAAIAPTDPPAIEPIVPAVPPTLTPPPSVAVDAKPARQHVIAAGDTPWSLAVKYYGDGKQWPKIIEANPGLKPERLPLGKTIVIP